MVTLVASPKSDPFCRPKIRCNIAKKGAKTLCFKISYKTPLNGRKNIIILHLSINLGFLTQNEICLADVLILGQVSPPDICFIFFLTQLFISKRDIPGKIPKISPGSYVFQRPFLRGLFLDRLIFVGAYLRREVCV